MGEVGKPGYTPARSYAAAAAAAAAAGGGAGAGASPDSERTAELRRALLETTLDSCLSSGALFAAGKGKGGAG